MRSLYGKLLSTNVEDTRELLLIRKIRLKDITDPQVTGPNGSIFQGKLQVLVDGAAQDIKDCGNACDMWMKKKVLLRVLVGPAWEGKLAAFTSAFAARRVEFEFALQIHTTTAVDAIQSITENMNERYCEPLLALVSRLIPQKVGHDVSAVCARLQPDEASRRTPTSPDYQLEGWRRSRAKQRSNAPRAMEDRKSRASQ